MSGRFPGAAVLGLAALAVVGVARAEKKKDGAIPPVQAAADQDTALRLARTVDLPALEKADRVVIEEVRPRPGRRVTLTGAKEIAALRRALKPAQEDPSAGKTAANLSFYRGKTLVRKVWVYASGEWGFYRPKGPDWTTGREAELYKVVARHLK